MLRCDWLNELWASHRKRLEPDHHFLVDEPSWFDARPPDPEENASYLGSITPWSSRNDPSKRPGFYVDLGKNGDAMALTDVTDEATPHAVIACARQTGWHLRIGKRIEGTCQDERPSRRRRVRRATPRISRLRGHRYPNKTEGPPPSAVVPARPPLSAAYELRTGKPKTLPLRRAKGPLTCCLTSSGGRI